MVQEFTEKFLFTQTSISLGPTHIYASFSFLPGHMCTISLGTGRDNCSQPPTPIAIDVEVSHHNTHVANPVYGQECHKEPVFAMPVQGQCKSHHALGLQLNVKNLAFTVMSLSYPLGGNWLWQCAPLHKQNQRGWESLFASYSREDWEVGLEDERSNTGKCQITVLH